MKLVALLSGGQDSVTSLYWAVSAGDEIVQAVIFDYGQRHSVEIDYARLHASRLRVPYHVAPIPMPSLSILTGEQSSKFAEERGLPSSFTPGRNLLFFTYAAQVASTVDAQGILTGVCRQDDAGYPDCRPGFVGAMESAIRHGFDWPDFNVVAPLLRSSKADTWALASSLCIVEAIVDETRSCYCGDETTHRWGHGCGECGACVERAKGWHEWQNGLVMS